MRLPLAWLGLAACTPDDGRSSRPVWGDEPTDTLPSFYGRVPRNIVMISMDTFRKDHLDRYGEHAASPFLTSLADDGVALDDFTQCSNWTMASTSCTLSGRHNVEAGMEPPLSMENGVPWPDGTPFLADWLRQVGFWSVLSSTNGWLGPEWGNDQGYNRSFHPFGNDAWSAYRQARQELDLARIDGRASEHWLLHVHLTEPHAAYAPPVAYLDGEDALPPIPWDLTERDVHYDARDDWPSMTAEEQDALEQHLRLRYRAEIRWMDDAIFRIFTDLKADGLLDDALLVFWTDHGEAFWEHGYQTHAWTLHHEENDAIAFFWSENILPEAVTGPTSAIDLVPTLLSLYGVPQPAEVTGLPLDAVTEDRARFATTVARLGPGQSVSQNGFKMTYSWFGQVRLYDKVDDPLETTNLYDPTDPSPEAFALWQELEPRVEAAAAVIPNYQPDWPEPLRSR